MMPPCFLTSKPMESRNSGREKMHPAGMADIIGMILDEKQEVETQFDGSLFTISRAHKGAQYSFLLSRGGSSQVQERGHLEYGFMMPDISFELDESLRILRIENREDCKGKPVTQEQVHSIVDDMIYLNPDY